MKAPRLCCWHVVGEPCREPVEDAYFCREHWLAWEATAPKREPATVAQMALWEQAA